jgi:predicted phage terminase large subunit-like protein
MSLLEEVADLPSDPDEIQRILDKVGETIRAHPTERMLEVYANTQWAAWLNRARVEQLPPEGDWRVWYLMGGRGSGKTRAGAEVLGKWEADSPPGQYAAVAPTFADARVVCAEDPKSGLLAVLGDRVEPGPSGWNRSLGEINLRSGSRIFLDGADDGALRIQGRNLSALWADEVGLWASQWERAWKESIRFAVRHDQAKIVATGTPKMGHPLVAELVNDHRVPVSRLKTSDNKANLAPAALEAFYEEFGGTRLGAQELDGEWIMALEGDLLKRAWWKYYPHRRKEESDLTFVKRLPTFQMVLVSVDTPLKDKESSDFVAIQVWGVDKANRYLLDARTERMGYDAAKRAVTEMSKWARRMWKTQHRTLIENAGFGAELIIDLKRDLGLVEKVSPGAEGNKGQRAFSAASDLETGQCFLPGRMKDDLSGPDESSPAITHSLVEEAALFQMDGSHHSHDDQVDAWSQAMNWLRSRQTRRARTWSSFKQG